MAVYSNQLNPSSHASQPQILSTQLVPYQTDNASLLLPRKAPAPCSPSLVRFYFQGWQVMVWESQGDFTKIRL